MTEQRAGRSQARTPCPDIGLTEAGAVSPHAVTAIHAAESSMELGDMGLHPSSAIPQLCCSRQLTKPETRYMHGVLGHGGKEATGSAWGRGKAKAQCWLGTGASYKGWNGGEVLPQKETGVLALGGKNLQENKMVPRVKGRKTDRVHTTQGRLLLTSSLYNSIRVTPWEINSQGAFSSSCWARQRGVAKAGSGFWQGGATGNTGRTGYSRT